MEQRKVFSKIGFIFAIFSVLAYLLQGVLFLFLDYFHITDYDTEVTLSTLLMYLAGILVFGLADKLMPMEKAVISPKQMRFSSIMKTVCMSYTVLMASSFLGSILTSVIEVIKGGSILDPVNELVVEMSVPVMIVLTVILAPVFEEFVFRKYLIDRTLPYGEGLSIVLSGLMFGLFHGNLIQFPYAFAIGCFFAFLYIRTGQIGYPILLHAIVNFLGSVVLAMIEFNDLLIILYELFVVVLGISGIVMWIIYAKKMYLSSAEKQIPKGKTFRCVYINVGMLAYIVFWLVNIIFATVI